MTYPTKKLGEVCDFRVIKNTKALPYIGMEDIESDTGRFFGSREIRNVKSTTAYFDQTSVLYGKLRPYLNKIFIPDFEGHCSTELVPLRPNQKILTRKWLAHWLMSPSIVKEMSQNISGSRMPRADLDHLKNLQIPLPSIGEQRKIVAKLERVLGKIKEAKKLREEAESAAAALLPAELHKIFSSVSSKNWELKRVGEVSEHSLGKMLDKVKNKGVPQKYLRNINVRWFGFDLSDVYEMRFTESEAEKYTATEGDVMICEGGEPGRAAIWREDYPIYFQKAVHRVRFDETVLPEYFLYFLYHIHLTRDIEQYFTGAGIKHFTGTSLNKFLVPIPPIAEQKRIAARLDSLSLKVQNLRQAQTQTASDFTALEQSLLQQAFAG